MSASEIESTGKGSHCRKAGKKRNSASGKAYLIGGRAQINKAKRIARHAKKVLAKQTAMFSGFKTLRGTARALRRRVTSTVGC